jgi:hypothetical protein
MAEPVGDLRVSAVESEAEPEPPPEVDPNEVDPNEEELPVFGDDVLSQFETHVARLSDRSKARRQSVQLRSAVLDREERAQASELDTLGKRQPQDEYQGDVNFRTLHTLLKMVDERGFERSAHQASGSTASCPLLSY